MITDHETGTEAMEGIFNALLFCAVLYALCFALCSCPAVEPGNPRDGSLWLTEK